MIDPPTPHLWRKVLVPTDFSDLAAAALRFAAAMQQQSGTEVVLLHVTEPAYEGLRVQTADLHARMQHEAESELEKLAATAFPEAANVRLMVGDGRAADVICKTAADEQVDAIIIPSHGASGFIHAVLGSVTDKVVRQARCHVLVIRE